MFPENAKIEVLEALAPVNPYKIIQFGSYARNNSSFGSGIDLYVITRDDLVSQSFVEKMSITTQVTKVLRILKSMILIS